MNFKNLLKKSLLVAVGLCAGASGAWGAATTYDFYAIAYSNTTDYSIVVGSASGITLNSQGLNLIADMNKTNYPTLRDESKAVTIGGKFACSGDFQLKRNPYGIRTTRNNAFRYFAVLDLNEGDKIIFNYNGSDPVFTFYSDNVTGKNVGDNVENGVEYTMKTGGHLDLQTTKNTGAYLYSIVITPNAAVESVTFPSATVSAVNTTNGERTITVTDGVSSTGADVTTYWSATTALNSSNYSSAGTAVVSNTITTTSDVIYLLSVSASPKYSSSVTYNVADVVTLATPTITLTSFTNNDTWLGAPTFTVAEDNSGLVGKPTADLTYTFTPDGGAESSPTAITSGATYKPTANGTLTVYASKTGYVSSSFSIPVSNIYTQEYASVDFSGYDNVTSFDGTWGAATSVTWGGNSVTGYLFTTAGNVEPRVHIGANNTIYFIPNWGLTRLGNSYGFRARNSKKGNISTFKYHTSTTDNTATTIAHVLNTSGSGLATDWTNYNYIPADNTLMQYKVYTPNSITESKNISSAGWATFCSQYPLDLEHATGLTDAYIVTGGAAGVLTKISVKSTTVPANTGLLLKGDEGTATIPVVASSSTVVSSNILVGKTAAEEIAAETGWVLMGTPSLGFYQNKKAFTVGANTAYIPVASLPVPAGTGTAPAFFSLFDGETTGINTVKASEFTVNGEYYNLAGQRVAQPTKGLYIVNGKKVIVK